VDGSNNSVAESKRLLQDASSGLLSSASRKVEHWFEMDDGM
jgi:hypothetical protein